MLSGNLPFCFPVMWSPVILFPCNFSCSRVFVVSLYKRDSRAIFLYVQDVSDDDFHIFFSSEVQAHRYLMTRDGTYIYLFADLMTLWHTA